jgi:light-regulated signal transduction histidine kinase (bacteriophytochrome)
VLELTSATIAEGIQRRLAERALNEQAKNLARSNDELQQFAYVASHDLQEPLRMIASFTQLLARRFKGHIDEEADEYIEYIVDGANRMQRLINDLLAYSRVGTADREIGPVDAERSLGRVLKHLAPTIAEASAEVTHDPLPQLLVDEVQLEQLFQNLIANAIKFRRLDVPAKIHVSARSEGARVELTVKDNGIGIEPEYAERIFVVFQRLHGREEYPGTGIGLAICKKIVERHGGKIWFASKLGEGTTFHLTLPAAE